jgi:DNA-directed RNA polymerase specialized sigma24 family protein
MEIKMLAAIAGIKRESLLQEIFAILLQWPELDRRIFSQAHYYGQSPEAISRSLQLDVKEVSAVLKYCDRRLYASLSSLRKTGMARLTGAERDLRIHALAS